MENNDVIVIRGTSEEEMIKNIIKCDDDSYYTTNKSECSNVATMERNYIELENESHAVFTHRSESEETQTREHELEEEFQEKVSLAGDELLVPTPASLTDDEVISENNSVDNESEIVVTVKFRTDTNETMTSAFKICSRIFEVKERVAKIFKVGFYDIRLTYEGSECDDLVPLSGLGVEPLGTIELGIQATDPDRVLAPVEFSRYIPIVDVITVRVPRRSGGFKDIVVEIENQCFTKKWLGGYRHRITKVEYHHAEIQTKPRERPLNSLCQHSRNTQTPSFPFKDVAISTQPSKSIQCDIYTPSINDKIIATDSKRFVPRREKINMPRLVAVITRIKRYYKRFTERYIKRQQKDHEQKLIEKEVQSKEQPVVTSTGLNVTPQSPLKRGDFHMLYLLIGKWWRREMTKIADTKSYESRKASLLDLLAREVALISVVERQRIEANKQISLKRDMRFLETTARPIVFRDSKGITSSIDTLATQQAREYKEIICSFLNFNVSKEQRISVLYDVKHLVKNYGTHCEPTQEILSLLDRERQLLNLGVSDGQLKGLRDRVMQLLLYFLNKYIFNFGLNTKKSEKTSSLHYCLHCRKLKPVSEFNAHIKMKSFTTCRSCEWMKNIGMERIDLSPFARILARVRQTEMENNCYSSVCYVLQVVGMYYLVRHIWCCKSILSDVQDLNDLVMVRFKKNEEWSPWNCILLTSEESLTHMHIKNVNKFYSRSFLDKVRWRHLRAKNHFLPLLMNDELMRETKLQFKESE